MDMKNNKEINRETPIDEVQVEAAIINKKLDTAKTKESRDRMDFQVYLMEEMIGKDRSNEENMEWVKNYAKLIGNIIDNKIFCINCSKIRLSIENRDFKEAARLIRPEIEKVEVAV
jgi:hypothetical protein